jgi:hypothetical protein
MQREIQWAQLPTQDGQYRSGRSEKKTSNQKAEQRKSASEFSRKSQRVRESEEEAGPKNMPSSLQKSLHSKTRTGRTGPPLPERRWESQPRKKSRQRPGLTARRIWREKHALLLSAEQCSVRRTTRL